MKKSYFLLPLAGMFLLAGCSAGVTQEEYDDLQAEYDDLTAEQSALEGELAEAREVLEALEAEYVEAQAALDWLEAALESAQAASEAYGEMAAQLGAVYSPDLDVTVSLGMARDEVEALVGSATAASGDVYGYDNGTLVLEYEDGAVSSIVLSTELGLASSFSWQVFGGITYGTSYEEVTALLGVSSITDGEYAYYYYTLDGAPAQLLSLDDEIIGYVLEFGDEGVLQIGIAPNA